MRRKQRGTIVIDATNLTSMAKAKYFLSTRDLLARPEESGGYGGLLLPVDSASNHPTGGVLVHGVVRAYGTCGALV